jgi:hypothetical protein
MSVFTMHIVAVTKLPQPAIGINLTTTPLIVAFSLGNVQPLRHSDCFLACPKPADTRSKRKDTQVIRRIAECSGDSGQRIGLCAGVRHKDISTSGKEASATAHVKRRRSNRKKRRQKSLTCQSRHDCRLLLTSKLKSVDLSRIRCAVLIAPNQIAMITKILTNCIMLPNGNFFTTSPHQHTIARFKIYNSLLFKNISLKSRNDSRKFLILFMSAFSSFVLITIYPEAPPCKN